MKGFIQAIKNNPLTLLFALLLNEIRNSGHENDKSYLFNEIILAEKRGLYEDAFSLIERYLKETINYSF